MDVIKRYDLLEAYLQAGLFKPATKCAPKKLIYYYYALAMHNKKIDRSRESNFRILLRIIEFLILYLLPMAIILIKLMKFSILILLPMVVVNEGQLTSNVLFLCLFMMLTIYKLLLVKFEWSFLLEQVKAIKSNGMVLSTRAEESIVEYAEKMQFSPIGFEKIICNILSMPLLQKYTTYIQAKAIKSSGMMFIKRAGESICMTLLRNMEYLALLMLPMVVAPNVEFELLINEVGTTSPPFIELMRGKDPAIIDLTKYSLLIVEKHRTKKLKIRSVLGLSGYFPPYPEYEIIHMGNVPNHPNLMVDVPPNNPRWKIYEPRVSQIYLIINFIGPIKEVAHINLRDTV